MSNGGGENSAHVGMWVKVLEKETGDEEVFHIVESREANYLENKIPPGNPMGRALLGSEPGDEVVVEGPNGPVQFSIVEVGK